MTAEEFKALKPELAHLEGDDLWNAMENYFLHQQPGEQILKSIKPFYKRYQLRYLFYIKSQWSLAKNGWSAKKRCSKCKKGVNTYFAVWGMDSVKIFCPHANHEYMEEPNTNISHKLYKFITFLQEIGWRILEFMHLLKRGERYGLFGDESRYVASIQFNLSTGKCIPTLKKRKWLEYIIIEK